MILTAHQPAYLPWLGLFHKIALADVFCFFECVQYQKRSFDNRNKINTHAEPIWLSVPVLNAGYRDSTYPEIKVNNTVTWQKKHWASIELNYKKAPYLNTYADGLSKFYVREWEYLVELNYELLLYFLDCLKIGTKVVRMREYQFVGQKNDLVLDMCRQLGAKHYIFGEQGINYCDEESFLAANVHPHFQAYQHPVYSQYGHRTFVPYMSVIDLLFNCGPESLAVILSGNVSRTELLEGKQNTVVV